jgi:hypothetical protein
MVAETGESRRPCLFKIEALQRQSNCILRDYFGDFAKLCEIHDGSGYRRGVEGDRCDGLRGSADRRRIEHTSEGTGRSRARRWLFPNTPVSGHTKTPALVCFIPEFARFKNTTTCGRNQTQDQRTTLRPADQPEQKHAQSAHHCRCRYGDKPGKKDVARHPPADRREPL